MTDPFANFIRTLLACRSRLLTRAHKHDGRVTLLQHGFQTDQVGLAIGDRQARISQPANVPGRRTIGFDVQQLQQLGVIYRLTQVRRIIAAQATRQSPSPCWRRCGTESKTCGSGIDLRHQLRGNVHLAGFHVHVNGPDLSHVTSRGEGEDNRHTPTNALSYDQSGSTGMHHIADVAQHKAVDLLPGGIGGYIDVGRHLDVYFQSP
jgi:hypothetical protein